MIRLSIIATLFYFTFHNQLYAYLDPGTGSIIIQAILGFIAAAGATITVYWKKFKEFFKRYLNRKRKLTKLDYDKGSFRDPAGKIFYYKNKVYREVFKSGLPRLAFLQKNNLLRELIEKKFLIKTEIIESDELSLPDKNNQIIEH